MTDIDACWLAAFIDAEGSFSLIPYNHKGVKGSPSEHTVYTGYTCSISASSVDRCLLENCQRIAGGYINNVNLKNPGFRRRSFRWAVKSRKVDAVMPSLLPFLVAKRQQAALVILYRAANECGPAKGQWGMRRLSEERRIANQQFRFAMNALNFRSNREIPAHCVEALAGLQGDIDAFLSEHPGHFYSSLSTPTNSVSQQS